MLLTLLQLNLQSSAQYQAYWIAHAAASWPGVPTGAQIKAGNLSNSSPASYSGSEPVTDSSTGTRTIDEVTAITGLSANTAYTLAWVVWDSVADTYSNVVVGDVTTDAAGTVISATLGTAVADGFTAGVNANTTVSATLGTAVADGFTAGVNANTTVSATLGMAAAAGFTATVTNGAGTVISATLGTAVAAGFTAGVNANTIVTATLGTAAADGFTAGVNANTIVTATLGTAAAAGFTAGVNANTIVTATLGTAAAAGFTAGVNANTIVTATLGTAVADGFAAAITYAQVVLATPGVATADGLTATITNAPPAAYVANAELYLDIGSGISMRLGGPRMPFWTTAARPVAPLNGIYGLNKDTNTIEVWNGSSWV
jgi:hypothetical protein